MARHRAGPATVQRAIAVLSARGLVEARPGRGTFVAAAVAAGGGADPSWQTVALGARAIDADALETLLRPPAAGRVVLSSGYLPADLQPTAALGAALARAARRPGAWDRVPPEGLIGLRAYFAAAVGGGATAGDVLICPGGQAGLAACLRGLAAPGAPVIVEAPTYLGALAAARAQGLVPVPSRPTSAASGRTCWPTRCERSGARARLPAAGRSPTRTARRSRSSGARPCSRRSARPARS